MKAVLIKSMTITFICIAYIHKPSVIFNHDSSSFLPSTQLQKPKQKGISKNPAFAVFTNKGLSDTTFTLKIENDKRVVDEKLKAKLAHEIKVAIAKHQLKKPYKIAMGFTKGARDVETFLFGEQIFYTLAESGFAITGTPLDMPEETPSAIPQVKVINEVIYVILSRM